MRILALEHPSHDPAPPALLEAEARALWGLCQAGLVREACFRADRREAVLLLEAASPDEAERGLATLPLVAGGHLRFELVPLVPYDGFSRLFRAETP